jgi:hypothetical protein
MGRKIGWYEMNAMQEVFNRLVSELAIARGLDPLEVLLNGWPMEFAEEVNKAIGNGLDQAKKSGLIGDYIMVARKIGPTMHISIQSTAVGHIEHCEVQFATGH